jgi:2-haloacid dehalogenase
MGRHADFWQVTGEALDFALADVGIADPDLRDALMREYRTLLAYDDAVRCLRTLRTAGRRAAILSNGSPDMLHAATDHAGLAPHLDAVLSIETAGVYKPAPAAYRVATEALGLAPAAIGFVSTNGWDAAGAAAFGCRVVWLNRFGKTPERLPAGPETVIDTLDALPPLLGLD